MNNTALRKRVYLEGIQGALEAAACNGVIIQK